MAHRSLSFALLAALALLTAACSSPEDAETAAVAPLPNGLLVSLSQFEVAPDGKVLPKPKDARLEILVQRGSGWETIVLEDGDSNVFHKAMVYDPGTGGPGILTLGGTAAALKLWRKGPDGFTSETLWEEDFGGKFSRMREAEAADLYGNATNVLAVATHDQGVVAIVSPNPDGGYEVSKIDQKPDIFVHEIEIGDLDGDGVLEVYATPSERNRLDGTPQSGNVVRFVPARDQGPDLVADLGDRHAKEILVDDVDGDGRDELYVSVEAVAGGKLEIRRYDEGTDPAGGTVIASIDDKLCRFLTAGDVDGDGKKEMIAAAFRSGLWLLRPGEDAGTPWDVTSIDRDSSGFEHAALLADLDEDGVHELYVASDQQGEVRRYVWNGTGFEKEVLQTREVPKSVFTWNLMPVPLDLVE
jgi:hypothetical protein